MLLYCYHFSGSAEKLLRTLLCGDSPVQNEFWSVVITKANWQLQCSLLPNKTKSSHNKSLPIEPCPLHVSSENDTSLVVND